MMNKQIIDKESLTNFGKHIRRTERRAFFGIPYDEPLNKSLVGLMKPYCDAAHEAAYRMEVAILKGQNPEFYKLPLGEGIYKAMTKGEMKTINEILKEIKK